MSKNALFKLIGFTFLSAILYVPVSSAAPIVEFIFNSDILASQDHGSTSPLIAGYSVNGRISFDDTDASGPTLHSASIAEYYFSGTNSFGYAEGNAPADWDQDSTYGLSIFLGNDYDITSSNLAGLPPLVAAEFSGLPTDGQTIDFIEIAVYQGDNEFGLFFIYDDLDVVQDLGDGLNPPVVDFSKTYTDFIYGEFSAGSEESWEAFGAIKHGDVSPVPIPAAVWLFGSGLFGLIGFTKKWIAR